MNDVIISTIIIVVTNIISVTLSQQATKKQIDEINKKLKGSNSIIIYKQ